MAPITFGDKPTDIISDDSSTTSDKDTDIISYFSSTTSLPIIKTHVPTSGYGSSSFSPSASAARSTTSLSSLSKSVYGSSPVPSITEAQTGTGAAHNDQPNITNIVVGVLVPVILIGIAALIFYKWYRKKYPVRMGIGRNFSTFSNPAYNKKQSTVNMEGEDKEKVEVEDGGHTNPGFEGGDKSEADASIDKHVAAIVEVQDISVETDLRPERALKNMSRDGQRKRATLIRTYDMERVEMDAAFEYASESDLGKRTGSEISYGNESTDTHTISVAFVETFDNRLMVRSKSTDFIGNRDSSADCIDGIEQKERSKSDTNGLLNVREQKQQQLANKSVFESENTNVQSKTPSVEEFETLEMITQRTDLTDFNRVSELQDDSIRSDTDNGALNNQDNVVDQSDIVEEWESGEGKRSHAEEFKKSETEINDEQSFESNAVVNVHDEETSESSSITIGFEILDSEIYGTKYANSTDSVNLYHENDISSKNNSNSSSMEHLNPEQLKSKFPKRLSLSMSSEHIVLEREPQSVLVQDSIIFEPETPNVVHLDCTPTVSPRRGRRAFTLNDICEKINYSPDGSHNKPEKISTSSPQINARYSETIDYSFFPKLTESPTSNDVDTQGFSASQQALSTSSVDSITNLDNRMSPGNGKAESSSIKSNYNNSENDELYENNMSFINTTGEVYSESDEHDTSDHSDVLEQIQTSIFREISVDKQLKQESNQTSKLGEPSSNESNPDEFSHNSTFIGIAVDEVNLVEITQNTELYEIPVDDSSQEDIIHTSTVYYELPVNKSNQEETIELNTLKEATNIKAGKKSKLLAGDFNFDAYDSSSDSDDSSDSSSDDEASDDKDPSNANTTNVTETFGSYLDNYVTEQNIEEKVMEYNSAGRNSNSRKDTAQENMSNKEHDQVVLRETEDLKDDNPDDSFRQHKDAFFEITDEQSDESNSEC